MLALATTNDGAVWNIAISNIAPGGHTLTFNGQDTVGNTRTFDETLSFTVVAPSAIGTVFLEGRADHGGSVVTLADGGGTSYSTTTSTDGSYGVSPPPRVYTATVEREGFLTAVRVNSTDRVRFCSYPRLRYSGEIPTGMES